LIIDWHYNCIEINNKSNEAMKTQVYILLFPLILAAFSVTKAQDYTQGSLGLPGDNLNLFAVMKLFQESETLEGFERSLNDPDNMINNLDLNGDNRIDYIRVIDNQDGDVHFIVLQVAINARENQDVALFIVQREANNQVRIQLIGDEDLYGKDYIIEPNYDAGVQYANETPNPGYTGKTIVVDGQTVVVNRVTTVEVAAWPLVRFIFLPTYVVWHSPWYWGYYPSWWHPWHPYYWHYYYGYHYHWYPHYYGYYRHWHDYRYPRWRNYYYGSRRAHSPYVATHINSGYYKTTYSRPETRRAGSEFYTKTHPVTTTRRATSTSPSGATTTRPSTSTSTAQPAVRTDTRKPSTQSRVSSSNTRTSQSTTVRSSTKSGTAQPAVRTETRSSSSGSRASSSSARKAPEQATVRSATKPGSTKSTVKTETRRSSSGSRVSSGSSSRKPSAGTQAKSRSGGSTKKSGERTKGASASRR
jgi:hypothetical protein